MSEEIKVMAPEQERPDYTEELTALLRSSRPITDLRLEMEDYHDSDLADLLEQLPVADRRRMYRILGLDRMSDVFAYLEDVGRYIEELDSELAADVIEGMDADDAVDVLEELDEDKRRELLELMDPDAAEDIQLIDSYDDDHLKIQRFPFEFCHYPHASRELAYTFPFYHPLTASNRGSGAAS